MIVNTMSHQNVLECVVLLYYIRSLKYCVYRLIRVSK